MVAPIYLPDSGQTLFYSEQTFTISRRVDHFPFLESLWHICCILNIVRYYTM